MKRSIPLLLVAFAALAGARSATAQERGTFALGLLGGIGGPFDVEGGGQDFDHRAIEASFGMLTNDNTMVVARVGELELEDDLGADGLFDGHLRFATVSGEYRFRQPSYDFGIYLGLGGYELDGETFFGDAEDERALGLAFGVTGDFDVSRHLSAIVEFSAHYAFFDRADLYGVALGGFAVHF